VIAPASRYAPSLPNQQALYAVYDGHGGSVASNHAARHLHGILLATPAFQEGRYEQALYDAFREEDRELRYHMQQRGRTTGGSTAVVALVDLTMGTLVTANVGDSRAVLARREEVPGHAPYLRAVRISEDQNPTDPSERRRIESHGGFVTHDGRVGEYTSAHCPCSPDLTKPSAHRHSRRIALARRLHLQGDVREQALTLTRPPRGHPAWRGRDGRPRLEQAAHRDVRAPRAAHALPRPLLRWHLRAPIRSGRCGYGLAPPVREALVC
jgi:hypothetical protein